MKDEIQALHTEIARLTSWRAPFISQRNAKLLWAQRELSMLELMNRQLEARERMADPVLRRRNDKRTVTS